MPTVHQPRFRKKRHSGVVVVSIKTPRGIQWLSTGQTSYAKAKAVVDQAMIDRLQMAACANALTPDVISRLTTGRRFTCQDILAAWKEESSADLSPDTLGNYESLLRQFLDDAEYARAPITAVRRVRLSSWVNSPRIPAGTRRARLAALRSYFTFANAAGYCVGNMAMRVQVSIRDLLLPEIETKETVPITAEEFDRLMASPKLTGFWRWATALGWWLGYRIRDVACLQWASLQGADNRVVIYPMKNGRRLELSLDDPLIGGGELRKVLLEMLEAASPRSPFCFPEMRAAALDPRRRAGLSVKYQRVLRSHGIKGKRFHSLRHGFAMRLKADGRTLDQIGAALGHGSTETTKVYTTHSPNTAGQPRRSHVDTQQDGRA
jgi:integrase